jgi:hypothetical protein
MIVIRSSKLLKNMTVMGAISLLFLRTIIINNPLITSAPNTRRLKKRQEIAFQYKYSVLSSLQANQPKTSIVIKEI